MKAVKTRNNVGVRINDEVWAQLENPDGITPGEFMKLYGHRVLEAGSRFYFQLGEAREGYDEETAKGQSGKLVPAWGTDLDSAKRYMVRHYPGFTNNKFVGMDLEGRCFKVDERSEEVMEAEREKRTVFKCGYCSAIAPDIDRIMQHERTHHENT